MEERGNKTIMSSVLFLDIVEYSKKSVTGQISLKDRFNSYLSAAICNVPVSDRIILDTGDGAAVNFLGDIEDALKAALSLRESIANEDPNVDPPLRVRVGINLGPVRLVRDINGQPNIVGDGINVAQRVMGFAEVNQILVSRSYHDAVSRLSPQYAGLFHSQGSRTDKHVREHEVYAVGRPGEKTTELLAATILAEEETKSSAPISASANATGNSAIKNALAQFKQADSKQRALYIGALIAIIVLAGVFLLKKPHNNKALSVPNIAQLDIGQTQAASGNQPISTVAPTAPVAPRANGKAADAGMVQPVTTTKPSSKKGDDQAKYSATQPKAKPVESARKGVVPAGENSAVEQNAEAHIFIICKEGTKFFVDGAEKGKEQLVGGVEKGKTISTGVTVAVSPGKHKVIVTSKSGELHTQNIVFEPGKTVHVKPKFCDQ
jgi:hypothetical protein